MRSFWGKLGNNRSVEEEYDSYETVVDQDQRESIDSGEGRLAVDLFDEGDVVIVQAMIPGVRIEDLEIVTSRDRIIIRGARTNQYDNPDAIYSYQELFWGSFSRDIELPDEVDIDNAEAIEDHGLLTIRLPKIDKERISRIQVRM